MAENKKIFASALKKLLNEKLSEAEEQSLKDEGFSIKNPTRKVAVMAALYKKAVSGDLSAIKELCSILNEDTVAVSGGEVTIIDDI
ncbi:MAG: hypothetical protein MJ076_01225 [Clostridia bacterium]|nr:hypothetical protein [Clostridia bacterium]